LLPDESTIGMPEHFQICKFDIVHIQGVKLFDNPDAVRLAAQRIGFYPQCQHQRREREQAGGIADKACRTEPLLATAKLASSMGIVKRNGAGAKVVQGDQAARMNIGAGMDAVGKGV
jgi:hypothetical protein